LRTYSLIVAHRGVGNVHLVKGEIPEAIAALERALALCRSPDIHVLFDVTAAHLGYAYALAGRLADGTLLIEQALERPASTGSADHALFTSYLGETHLLAGRREAALAAVVRALTLARDGGERAHEAHALRVLGAIAARAPDADAADRYYLDGLALALDLGMRPLVAHCHLGLGGLYRQTGKHDQAREHLTTAATMYREMDMQFWLPQAEAEL